MRAQPIPLRANNRPPTSNSPTSITFIVERLRDMTQQVPAQGRAYLALAPIENIDASEAVVDALGEAYLAFGQEHPGQVPTHADYSSLLRALVVEFPSDTRDELAGLLNPQVGQGLQSPPPPRPPRALIEHPLY